MPPVAPALRTNPPTSPTARAAAAAEAAAAAASDDDGSPTGRARRDRALVRLFAAACHRRWDALPALAAAATDAGCTPTELRACVRHLVVTSGYAPCLGATNVLVDAGAFGPAPPPPGKCGGPPGDAFACVYGNAAAAVATRVHAADPVLAAWIAAHLYGDVYSSPGLPLATKQLLTVAGLADADMPTQLYGHAVAALRCGAPAAALQHAVDAAFKAGGNSLTPDREAAYARAVAALDDARRRHEVAVAAGRAARPPEPAVAAGSVWTPPVPASLTVGVERAVRGG